jgi:hypothetical protein
MKKSKNKKDEKNLFLFRKMRKRWTNDGNKSIL